MISLNKVILTPTIYIVYKCRNMEPIENGKVTINNGVRIGRLLVGDLVTNVRGHELYYETPLSYISLGRLRECRCDCGRKKLISEVLLADGRARSCGCLRQEIRERSRTKILQKSKDRMERIQINATIRHEQVCLRQAQLNKNVEEEKAIASKLRTLYGRKAVLTRKARKG